jgi:hypothetical protein
MAAFARTLFPTEMSVGSAPPYLLTRDEVNAELEIALVGQRRKNGRPSKPRNCNDAVLDLLREQRPKDFVGRFTLTRADLTRKWLEGKRIYKSTDAVLKMVNRAKRKTKRK